MDAQLTLLLELQDLRAQHRELSEGPAVDLQAEHFNLDPGQALQELDAKMAELEAQLTPQVRARYNRMRAATGRAVVPVINGVCYGCFVSIATARAGEHDPNDTLSSCEHCGRFIYIT